MKLRHTRIVHLIALMAAICFVLPTATLAQDDTGTLRLAAFECPLSRTPDITLHVIDASTSLPEGSLEGCDAVPATFIVEGLNGFHQTHGAGDTALPLPSGTYTVTDELTGASATIEVATGNESEVILVTNVDAGIPARQSTSLLPGSTPIGVDSLPTTGVGTFIAISPVGIGIVALGLGLMLASAWSLSRASKR